MLIKYAARFMIPCRYSVNILNNRREFWKGLYFIMPKNALKIYISPVFAFYTYVYFIMPKCIGMCVSDILLFPIGGQCWNHQPLHESQGRCLKAGRGHLIQINFN